MTKKYAVQMFVHEFDSMREAAEFAEELSEVFTDMPESEGRVASIIWGVSRDDRETKYVH